MSDHKPSILLVKPPFYRHFGGSQLTFPRGLLTIASFLDDNSIFSRVYNADLDRNVNIREQKNEKKIWGEVRKVLSAISPDVVFISFTTPEFDGAFKTAKIAKDINDNLKVVVGGAHPTALPKKTLKNKYFDFVVKGEAEVALYEFMEKITGNGDLRSVKGLFYSKNDEIIFTGTREPIKNLERLPKLKEELLLFKDYYPHSVWARFPTSRGCYHNCTFCIYPGLGRNKVRFRDPDSVVDEIEDIQKRKNTSDFFFTDSSFTLNSERALDICRKINERGLDIRWGCLSRADEITEQLVRKFKGAGCYYISLGAETGSQRLLNEINKNITVDEITEASKIIKDLGIFLHTFIVVGFPSETRESLEDTLNLIREIDPDFFSFRFFVPLPGSQDYYRFKSKIKANNWSEFHFLNSNIVERDKIDKKVFLNKYKEIYRLYRQKKLESQNKLMSRDFIRDKLKECIWTPKSNIQSFNRFLLNLKHKKVPLEQERSFLPADPIIKVEHY